MNYLILIPLVLVTICLNVVGQTLLKMGSGQNPFNLYIFSGLSAYGFSTISYIMILGKMNLSVVYPLVIGSTIIATTFAGTMIFKEQVSSVQWIGIGLMLSGISAVAFGKLS